MIDTHIELVLRLWYSQTWIIEDQIEFHKKKLSTYEKMLIQLPLTRDEATAIDHLAAFDTIDHFTLMYCLSSWYWWCSSGLVHLSNTSQLVKIGSILSDTENHLYGVPQTSAKFFKIILANVSSFMLMMPSCRFIVHTRTWLRPWIS